MEQINAVGRRKAAIARVFITEGNGDITINKRSLDVYFPSPILQFIVKQPLNTLGVADKYDIKVNLDGGGYKGQAEALRLAIARALVKINPEDKSALRKEGFMTRDPRAVERKKPRDSSSASANQVFTTHYYIIISRINSLLALLSSQIESLVSKSHRPSSLEVATM